MRSVVVRTLLALFFVLVSTSAAAHDADVNTARVTLRDGNVTIRVSLDVETWVQTSAGIDAPLVRAEMAPAALDAQLANLRATLQREVALVLGDEDVGVTVRRFPTANEVLRASAHNFIDAQQQRHSHRQRLAVELEGTAPVANATRVSVAFPPSLGEVAVTFVEPQTRWIQEGERAQFESRAATQAPPPRSETTAPHASTSLWLGLVSSAILLFFFTQSQRRRRTAGLVLVCWAALFVEGCNGETATVSDRATTAQSPLTAQQEQVRR